LANSVLEEQLQDLKRATPMLQVELEYGEGLVLRAAAAESVGVQREEAAHIALKVVHTYRDPHKGRRQRITSK